jgi:hypothetical protein
LCAEKYEGALFDEHTHFVGQAKSYRLDRNFVERLFGEDVPSFLRAITSPFQLDETGIEDIQAIKAIPLVRRDAETWLNEIGAESNEHPPTDG